MYFVVLLERDNFISKVMIDQSIYNYTHYIPFYSSLEEALHFINQFDKSHGQFIIAKIYNNYIKELFFQKQIDEFMLFI